MLTSADMTSFGRGCALLYQPDLAAGCFARRTVEFLRELVPADMYCVGDLDPKTGKLQVDFSAQDAGLPALMEGFGRTMGNHKLFNWDATVNGGKPFFRGDFYTTREFKNLDVFRESFGLVGWTDHAAVHVPTDDGHVVFIGLERAGGPEYSERDREILTLAQEQLANARRLARAWSGARLTEPPQPRVFRQAGFTGREAEVLRWLTEGKSNAEMAKLMGVGVPAVKQHLTGIFNKTGMGNRLAVTLYALDLARRAVEADDVLGRRLQVQVGAGEGRKDEG
jgi:DNA-binding CsgD family transcriptional regulator